MHTYCAPGTQLDIHCYFQKERKKEWVLIPMTNSLLVEDLFCASTMERHRSDSFFVIITPAWIDIEKMRNCKQKINKVFKKHSYSKGRMQLDFRTLPLTTS